MLFPKEACEASPTRSPSEDAGFFFSHFRPVQEAQCNCTLTPKQPRKHSTKASQREDCHAQVKNDDDKCTIDELLSIPSAVHAPPVPLVRLVLLTKMPKPVVAVLSVSPTSSHSSKSCPWLVVVAALDAVHHHLLLMYCAWIFFLFVLLRHQQKLHHLLDHLSLRLFRLFHFTRELLSLLDHLPATQTALISRWERAWSGEESSERVFGHEKARVGHISGARLSTRYESLYPTLCMTLHLFRYQDEVQNSIKLWSKQVPRVC